MSVPATVVETPCGEVNCADQQIVKPEITIVEGRESLRRRRAVEVTQAQQVTIEWAMLTKAGLPLDLSTCGPMTATLRLKEATLPLTAAILADVTPTIENAAEGILHAVLTPTITANPGVYIGDWGVFDANNTLLFVNRMYLIVSQSFFGNAAYAGPPTLDAIKLSVRSSDFADSTLLQSKEWDDAEIAQCLVRPVVYWNEASPPVGVNFTTQSFPFRERWLEATVGELLILASQSYMRDHMPYTAAGISVDDKNKWQQYGMAGLAKRKEYYQFVLQQKVSINMDIGSASFGSDYLF